MIEFKPDIKGRRVADEKEQRLREIEATQEKLKESIETSRELAVKAQRLLDKHRKDLKPGP